MDWFLNGWDHSYNYSLNSRIFKKSRFQMFADFKCLQISNPHCNWLRVPRKQVPADIDSDIKIDKLSTFLSTFLPYRVLIEGESPLSRYKRYIKDDRYDK